MKREHTPDHEIVMLPHCIGCVYVKVKFDAVTREAKDRKYTITDSRPR